MPKGKSLDKRWLGIATLVGSTVGVGVYGIPFTFAKAGTGVGFLFLAILTVLFVTVNLMYGEVVLRTHNRHQFIGYIRKYLGGLAYKAGLFVFWAGTLGTIICILIVTGDFLSQIFSFTNISVSPVVCGSIFFFIALIVVMKGLKMVSHVDLFIMFLLVFIMGLIVVTGVWRVKPENYITHTGMFWFLPFGVMLFALDGILGIPLVREVMTGSEHMLRRVLVIGTIIPAVLYLAFSLVVVGISGENTSPTAIASLGGILGGKIVLFGALFGFLSSSILFISIATALREALYQDFGFKKKWHYLAFIILPYVLFLTGARNFIDMLDLIGGVGGSLALILLMLVYHKAKNYGDREPEYNLGIPGWLSYIVVGALAAGAIYTLVAL
ncbi:MAG: amino acid permease [Parcubacteria group bacterium Licking1014_17]|nr:MAG: amino acid permease [Parcubacteria group bacterium Licking1014_17]